MNAVKVGQVWRDKDKRRGTVIEIIDTFHSDEHGSMALGLVVGTEEEREYKVERLVSRWEMTKDKPEEPIAEPKPEAKPKHKTREAWLEAAVKALTKSVFAEHDVPTVRVSVGWPGGRGKKTGVMGQCFATRTTDDKVAQIFVSPAYADAYQVVETVAHEIVHAIDDCKSGHKKDFVKIAKSIGFLAPWKETPANDELKEKIQAIVDKLGPYPHAAIRPEDRPVVQKTYMLKVLCTEDPDYFVRMTKGKIEEYGAPSCPCHNLEMEVEEK